MLHNTFRDPLIVGCLAACIFLSGVINTWAGVQDTPLPGYSTTPGFLIAFGLWTVYYLTYWRFYYNKTQPDNALA